MDFYVTILIISALLVLGGLYIVKIQQHYFNEPLIAMIAGIIVGPYVLDILDMEALAHPESFMQSITRFTIGLALVATALRLPLGYAKNYKKDQAVILSGGMLLMWIFSAIVTYIFFDIEFTLALLVGAVITPTDPVVSSAIVSGKFAEKYLPANLRHTISFESGANDGLAFPIVLCSMFILGYTEVENWGEWVLKVVLWENVASAGIGLLLGYILGELLRISDKCKYMIPKTVLPFTLASTFMVLAFLEFIHTNSIIGIFAFGLMMNNEMTKNERIEEEKVQESMERIFTIPVFFLFGLFLPMSEWSSLGILLLIGFSLCILFVRRPPAVFILKPFLKHFSSNKEVGLLGWYGPIGVAAIFYSMHVLHETPYREVWVMSSFVIFTSTIVHGISSLPLGEWYHKTTQREE